ncbi:MAG: Oligopeptidase, partial [Bacteroidota bacterium]
MEILLHPFKTKYNTAPFSQIQMSDYKPAFEAAIDAARAEIDAITTNLEKPTFENTIEALDFSGQTLDRLSSIFFNLNSAETCDEMQRIAQEVSPLLTAFSNDISLNEELFQRVKAVYNQKSELTLTPEQSTLLNKKYKSFARNGALLTEDKKSRLREIDTELAKLKLTFGENVLAETNNYQLHITNEADLKGLPEGAIEIARALAESKNVEGWIFTLDFPSYLPFVTYADNRE